MNLFALFFLIISQVFYSNVKDKAIILENKKSALATLISGRYSEISIAMDSNNSVTGVYEYYDNWDEKFKEYTEQNVFYFEGKLEDNVILVKTAWPTSEQRLLGKIKVTEKGNTKFLNLVLNNAPNGYAAEDLTREGGFIKKLDQKKDWIQVRLVKSSRSRLYNAPDVSTARKGYLVKNDIVKVITVTQSGWMKIEYNPKNDNSKSTIVWMREEDFYSTNVSKW